MAELQRCKSFIDLTKSTSPKPRKSRAAIAIKNMGVGSRISISFVVNTNTRMEACISRAFIAQCKIQVTVIWIGSFNHEGDIHDPNVSTTKLIVESFIPQYFPTQRTMLCEGVSATSFYAGLFGITATEESTHYLHIERAKTTIVSHTNESISTCQCAAASIEYIIERIHRVNTAASEGDEKCIISHHHGTDAFIIG